MNFDLKIWCRRALDTYCKYPMGLTQVPKPMAFAPFVMLSFQCVVASSLGQSMPHSCSFRDPMCFPFSISGNMPATKKNHYILPLAVKISDSSAVKICSIRRSQFQRQMWDQAQNHQKNKSSEHFETTWFLLLSTRFISFLLPEVQEAHPITKVDLKQQVRIQLNIPKHSRKSPAHVRTPSVISPAPLPKRPIDIPFSVLRSFPAFAD